MEDDRQWDVDWEDLDVKVQKCWTLRRSLISRKHSNDPGGVHLPLDTWKQLKSLHPDVIVAEELGFRSLMCVARRLAQKAAPLVLVCNVSEHTERNRGTLRRILRRFLLRNCSTVTVGGSSGERYIKSLGVSSEKLFRFPYAAVSKPFLELDLERDVPQAHRFVYCGAINERKGTLPLVRAIAHCAEANAARKIELTIIGDGPLRPEIEAFIRPANLQIHLLGHLQYNEMAAVYQTQSAMVLPTMSDEWGLVVNEALAAGLPVCGSVYSQAVMELVNSSNGWQFRPDDPRDFANALTECLETSPERVRQMRHNARQAVLERTPQWAANQLLEAIDRAMAQK